jgi:hypothetical protein
LEKTLRVLCVLCGSKSLLSICNARGNVLFVTGYNGQVC